MIVRRRPTDENYRDIEYFQSEEDMIFEWIDSNNAQIMSVTAGSHQMQSDDSVLIKILDDRSLADFTLRFE